MAIYEFYSGFWLESKTVTIPAGGKLNLDEEVVLDSGFPNKVIVQTDGAVVIGVVDDSTFYPIWNLTSGDSLILSGEATYKLQARNEGASDVSLTMHLFGR